MRILLPILATCSFVSLLACGAPAVCETDADCAPDETCSTVDGVRDWFGPGEGKGEGEGERAKARAKARIERLARRGGESR